MAVILTKKKDTTGAPVAGDLTNSTGGAELAVNTADKRLYTKDSGGNVVEVGTNPGAAVTFTAGTVSAPAITTTGDTNTGVFFPAADTIAFAEGGAEAMRINSDSQVVTTAGTVSLPAITTTGDVNTGIFFPAADTIAFTEGGAEAMRIDSSGNVGIGTTTINTTLAVNGNALFGTGAWPTNDLGRSGGRFVNTSSTEDGILAIVNMQSGVASNRGGYLYLGARATTGVDGATFATVQGQRENATSGNYASFLGFSTSSSAGVVAERLRIDSSGNVGIGTTSPSSYFSGGTNLVIGNASGNTGMTISSGNASLGRILFADGTSGAEAYQGWVYYTHADNAMSFATAGSERARITSGGLLAINATATASGNTNCRLFVKGVSGYDVCEVQVATNGTYAFDFRNAAGTNVGNITVNSGGTAFTTTSDYRLKENITPMQNALSVVNQLKPCTYTWKSDGSAGQGFIAHELQSVIPDCVTGEKDATQIQQYEISPAVYEDVIIPAILDDEGNEVEPERTEKKLVSESVIGEREVPRYQGVDTSYLVATLTAAIQELKAELDTVKAQNTAFEARLAALESK